MTDQTARPKHRHVPEPPSTLGLLGFGLTALLVHFNAVGFFPLHNFILGVGIVYGALWQIVVGLWEWKKGRALNGTTFTLFGFFWISQIGISLFPASGLGSIPPAAALAPLLIFWGLFALGMSAGALANGPLLPVLFGATALSLFSQGAGIILENVSFTALAGYLGIFSSVIALAASGIQVLDLIAGRPPTPFGWARRAP